jgi:hypothetical protein
MFITVIGHNLIEEQKYIQFYNERAAPLVQLLMGEVRVGSAHRASRE